MKKNSLIVGSIAYDILFSIYGNMKNELIVEDNAVKTVNMMFTAKSMQKFYGGTAGNIAYGLAKLGDSPLTFSIAGKDFEYDYEKYLTNLGARSRVIIKKEGYTSAFYAVSDDHLDQIGIWQPNIYGETIETSKIIETVSKEELENVSVAIFSPGTATSTLRHIREFRDYNKDATVIFDPAQSLSVSYSREIVEEVLAMTTIVTGNEVEIDQFKKLFGLDIDKIFSFGVQYVIETLGDKGSIIHEKGKKTNIKTQKPRNYLEATGAGDAYRSGLIYGLANNYDIYKSCDIASFIAARSVEYPSGQGYEIDLSEISSFK